LDISRKAADQVCWALLALGTLCSCTVNPVTGKTDFALRSEESEISLGRKYHQQIINRIAPLANEELQQYVQSVGQQVAANSHRSHLQFTFTVLDSPDINAFALPGGYVYINRGLLVYLQSEAQLAGVLAHEVGHVTARHGVQQESYGSLLDLVTKAAELAEGNEQVVELGGLIGKAVITGYGRDMELQADELGAQYLALTGYDPQAMVEVIGVLKNREDFSRLRQQDVGGTATNYHGLFASHPTNDTRLNQIVSKAQALVANAVKQEDRRAFLRHLEGVTFGDSSANGIRRGNRLYHKDLNIAFEFPEGWLIENGSEQIVGIPRGEAGKAYLAVQVRATHGQTTPQQYLAGLKLGTMLDSMRISASGLDGHTALVQTAKRTRVRIAVVYHQLNAYIFLGEAINIRKYDPLFLDTIENTHRLRTEEAALAEPLVISLLLAGDDTRYADLGAGSALKYYPEQQLRLLNGHYPDGQPKLGQWLKLVD
jgi:predicted Zn-dependent protease|tara:strand:- start:6046 stop:7500 length:1455 start_codon:yes stop_codon:yes gene_type:complete